MIEKDFIGNKIYGKFYFGDMEKYEQIKNNGQLENCFYYIEIPNFAYKDYTVEKDVYGPTGATQESKTDEYAYVLYLKDKEIYHSREVEKHIMNLMENYGLASILNTYQNKLDLTKTTEQTIQGAITINNTLTAKGTIASKKEFIQYKNDQKQFELNDKGITNILQTEDKFIISSASGSKELLKVNENGVEDLVLYGSINGKKDGITGSAIAVVEMSADKSNFTDMYVKQADIDLLNVEQIVVPTNTDKVSTLGRTYITGDLEVSGTAYLNGGTNINFQEELDGATLKSLTLTDSLVCKNGVAIESENLKIGETIEVGKNFIQIGKIKLSYNEEESRLEIINMDTGEASTDVSE